MKVMSEGLQKYSTERIKAYLQSKVRNSSLAFLTGLVTTAIIQSSSATSVMTVSLVNASLINLSQAAGLLFGANVGTTITAWLLAIGGFRFDIGSFAIVLLAVGVPLLFLKGGRMKYLGEILVGFSIIFLGIDFLKEVLPQINRESPILDYLQSQVGDTFVSRLTFLGFGFLITILLQSSSATIALISAATFQGWLTFELATSMVLGANIGTTITAELSAIVGNIQAKRAARIHTLFNVIGAIIVLPILPFFLQGIQLMMKFFWNIPQLQSSTHLTMGLAAFHTSFNLFCSILFLPLIPKFIDIAKFLLPDKPSSIEAAKSINSAYLTPELAIFEVQKDIKLLIENLRNRLALTRQIINTVQDERYTELYNTLEIQESKDVRSLKSIQNTLSILSSESISQSNSLLLRNYIVIMNHLQQISKLIIKIKERLMYKSDNKIWFIPEQRVELNTLFQKLDEMCDIISKNFDLRDQSNELKQSFKSILDTFEDEYVEFSKKSKKRKKRFDYNKNGAKVYQKIILTQSAIAGQLKNISKLASISQQKNKHKA